jgi:hypothetical protein
MQILCSLKSAIFAGLKNRRTTTTKRYKNERNSRTRPLAFTAVGTLIHKGYCSPHLAAAGHTTTGSRVEFKFPELLGSTSYMTSVTHAWEACENISSNVFKFGEQTPHY